MIWLAYLCGLVSAFFVAGGVAAIMLIVGDQRDNDASYPRATVRRRKPRVDAWTGGAS